MTNKGMKYKCRPKENPVITRDHGLCFTNKEKRAMTAALKKKEGKSFLKKQKTKVAPLLLLFLLIPSVCHALPIPSEKTIRAVLYEHKQISMKVDIIYKLMKEQYINSHRDELIKTEFGRKRGEKAWGNFLLDCGKEEIIIKHKED